MDEANGVEEGLGIRSLDWVPGDGDFETGETASARTTTKTRAGKSEGTGCAFKRVHLFIYLKCPPGRKGIKKGSGYKTQTLKRFTSFSYK